MTETLSSDSVSVEAAPAATLEWAFKAYHRFLGILSPEVRRHLGERREDAYTVVYGRTQVGKSTLILHLLGLRPDAVSDVSAVLRGRRKAGYSSTAVPTEYRRSNDERWRVHWGTGTRELASDCEAEAEFALVRKTMERNAVSPTSGVCVVEIPARHFGGETTAARGTRILDLPGVEAANPVESEFVERLAENLVPNADLVLLVGRADDLSFLSPEHVALPGIADWQHSPSRFRVVTTYSFTPESVQEFARETGCVGDAAAYRARLMSEIQRFRPLEPEALVPKLYFPLEFGESWRRASLDQTPLKTMVDGLMDRLRQDVVDAMTPVGRLVGALDAHIVVTKVHAARLEAIKKSERRLERARADRIAAVVQLETKLRAQRNQVRKSQADIAALTDAKVAHGADAPATQLRTWAFGKRRELERQVAANKDTGTFLSVIGEATRSLEIRIPMTAGEVLVDGGVEPAAFWKRVHKHAGQLDAANVSRTSEREFAALQSKLEGYVIESYWFKGERSDYASDVNALLVAHKRLTDAAAAALTSELMKHAQEMRRQLRDEARLLESRAAETERLLIAERSAVGRIKAALTECGDEHRHAERTHQGEMERSRQFTALLVEEYNRAVEEAYRGVTDAPDAVTAFEELVYGSALRAAREGVWARMGNVVEQ